jgi:hypothetical protein
MSTSNTSEQDSSSAKVARKKAPETPDDDDDEQPTTKKKKKKMSKKKKEKPDTLRRILVPCTGKPSIVTWANNNLVEVLELMQRAVSTCDTHEEDVCRCNSSRIERYPTKHSKQNVEVYVNEEGMLLNLPYNERLSMVLQSPVYGNAVITCSTDEGDDADLPEECTLVTWKRFIA